MPPDVNSWIRKRDIVLESAAKAGRKSSDITLSVTREAPLPQNSGESAQWLETLQQWAQLGVRQFVLDFGHVTSTEPVLRFAEEVIGPMRAG